jgi:hypothetical protein
MFKITYFLFAFIFLQIVIANPISFDKENAFGSSSIELDDVNEMELLEMCINLANSKNTFENLDAETTDACLNLFEKSNEIARHKKWSLGKIKEHQSQKGFKYDK